MNQPLNYTVDSVRYYYDLDQSSWYVIEEDRSKTYVDLNNLYLYLNRVF